MRNQTNKTNTFSRRKQYNNVEGYAHEIMRFYHPSGTNGVQKPSAHLFVPPCLTLIDLNPAFHPPQFLKYLIP